MEEIDEIARRIISRYKRPEIVKKQNYITFKRMNNICSAIKQQKFIQVNRFDYMSYSSHPLIRENTIESRLYQETILNTAKTRNTLVVLPTGTGKTPIAVLLAAERLEKFPESRVLVLAPTKPLASQHEKSFKKFLNIDEEEMVLLTGAVPAELRAKKYSDARIIFSTPQTSENDIKNGSLNLKNFSLLVIDEAHRSIGNYAYNFVARTFKEQSNGIILALTASPGSSEEKIKQICGNLFIEAVEIRSEKDGDVNPYIQDIIIEIIKVDLPEELVTIQSLLKTVLKKRIERLNAFKLHILTKKDLLDSQRRISRNLHRNKAGYAIISFITEAIKIWHLLEMMETQSISASMTYIEKLKKDKSKSAQRLLKDSDFLKAVELMKKSGEHPKIGKLTDIVSEELKAGKKIIIFSHYRDNIDLIKSKLSEVTGCGPVVLIGQSGSKGLSQKEQIDIVRSFDDGTYNCLITSPIGEEGLHIGSADTAIFYDSVASEIRTIQRRGRVGRSKIGKIVFLITRGTRDEANFYIAKRKEKKIKDILSGMKKDMEEKQEQKRLGEF